MSSPTHAVEQTEIVRKRRVQIRSLQDIVNLMEQMRIERCECEVRIIFRCGGTPTSAVVEERAKYCA